MKTILLTRQNSPSFVGQLRKMAKNNGSMVFPQTGSETKGGSKFKSIRKKLTHDNMRLTTKGISIYIEKGSVIIDSPLNAGFGYGYVDIPFGKIIFAFGSFFWKDAYGYWRQLKFEKQPGWALVLSGGRNLPYIPQDLEKDINCALKIRKIDDERMQEMLMEDFD